MGGRDSAIAAASRRPRLSPCAPIGGMRCAASPMRAIRTAAKRCAVSAPSGKVAAAGLDRDLAEDRMRAPFEFEIEAASRRAERSVRLQLASTTQTMLERSPGSGTVVKGPCSVWNSVECRDAGGYARRCRSARSADSSCFAFRCPAASRQIEFLPSAPTASCACESVVPSASATATWFFRSLHRNRAACERVAGSACPRPCFPAPLPNAGSRCSRRRHRARSRRNRNASSGARQSRAVSSTIRKQPHRRRLVAAMLPDAERRQRRDRTRQQRRGAMVICAVRAPISAVDETRLAQVPARQSARTDRHPTTSASKLGLALRSFRSILASCHVLPRMRETGQACR